MNFELVLKNVIQSFEEENRRYGLIGGLAPWVMGILRSTIDIDFLLLVDDLKKADRILTGIMQSTTAEPVAIARALRRIT